MSEPELLPDESPDILEELTTVFVSPEDRDLWLDTPNNLFWCKPPREALNTSQGVQLIRDMIGRIRHGMVS